MGREAVLGEVDPVVTVGHRGLDGPAHPHRRREREVLAGAVEELAQTRTDAACHRPAVEERDAEARLSEVVISRGNGDPRIDLEGRLEPLEVIAQGMAISASHPSAVIRAAASHTSSHSRLTSPSLRSRMSSLVPTEDDGDRIVALHLRVAPPVRGEDFVRVGIEEPEAEIEVRVVVEHADLGRLRRRPTLHRFALQEVAGRWHLVPGGLAQRSVHTDRLLDAQRAYALALLLRFERRLGRGEREAERGAGEQEAKTTSVRSKADRTSAMNHLKASSEA